MKPGDFVALRTTQGTFIIRVISDDGETITAEVGTTLGVQIFYNIPKNIVSELRNGT